MTSQAVIAFFGVIMLFAAVTAYIFSRINVVRLPSDAAPLAMIIYIIGGTAIIVATLLFLVRF